MALLLAAMHGHAATVELLVDRGADANARGAFGSGCTALWLVAYHGQTAAVAALLRRGADPALAQSPRVGHNEPLALRRTLGFSPLHAAAARGHRAAVDALLRAVTSALIDAEDAAARRRSSGPCGPAPSTSCAA
jgi:hypothetical protein